MLWLALIAGAGGFLIGLYLFRVQAIIAASATLIPICICIAPIMEWNLLGTAIGVLTLGTALQGGYLVGAGMTGVWSKMRAAEPAAVPMQRPPRVARVQSSSRV